MRGRLAVVAAVLALAVGLVPAAATAQDPGSITFIRDGEVWVMASTAPDAAVQLTDTGGQVVAQAQDDAGRVVVGLDGGSVIRVDRTGAVIAGPFQPASAGSGVFSFDVTPDGSVFTYTAIGSCTDGSGLLCSFVDFARTDGSDSSDVRFVIDDARDSAFYGDGGVLMDYLSEPALHQLGTDSFDVWFSECEQFPCESFRSPVISPDLAWLASADSSSDEETFEFTDQVRLHRLTAPPPAVPTLECTLRTPTADNVITNISWSPDGTAVVFEEYQTTDTFGETLPVGLWSASGIGTGSCAEVQDSMQLLVAGTAASPDWGPAPAGGQTPPPPPPPDGGSTPPQPDQALVTLPDGTRLDGGGSADPVGQAVATSQAIWADGGAGLVVLATADRFPDALAGSALAGERGPILLTPFGEQLDPRVHAEIARVTGGEGVVAVLGGTSAVTEAAAEQARTAAGSPTCPAPFPSSCRYAGTGREQTAALIGETVVALNGGSGNRALLARGDVFADAITGGAYAAEAGVPILLTPPTQLNDDTRAFIQAQGIQEVIVLGGTAAVSDATVAALPVPSRRIAGPDRTATAAAIATQLWDAEGIGGGGVVLVNVRHDQGWQTALAAAVVSALANAPQLGVENPPADPSPATLQAAAAVGGPVVAFGSTGLVSDAQLQAVQDAS